MDYMASYPSEDRTPQCTGEVAKSLVALSAKNDIQINVFPF
jgi:hypothetical protein